MPLVITPTPVTSNPAKAKFTPDARFIPKEQLMTDYAALFRRAREKARAQHRRNVFDHEGECLMRTRMLVNVPAKFLTAKRAWLGAEHKHPTSNPDDAPAGSMGFFIDGRNREL